MRFDRIGWTNRALGVLALGVLVGSATTPAQAAFLLDFEQVGANVVVTGSGTIDLTGLTGPFPNSFSAFMTPQLSQIANGSPTDVPVDVYSGVTGGPASFGPGNGSASFPNTGSGDLVFVNLGMILVPSGYVSDNALSDISTYENQTFASLGVTPGTYVYTWGSGDHADTLTLEIGVAVVPEPASLTLLGGALLGFTVIRSHRRKRRRDVCLAWGMG